MSQDALIALLGGRVMGRVLYERRKRGRLRFIYDESWRSSPNALALSLSMPLTSAEYDHDAVEAFLGGLLPDNPSVLKAWGRRFGVSPRNAFSLLTHVGEDCAGAVQFVQEARADAIMRTKSWEVQWLDDAGVEERLREIERDRTAWRTRLDTGQFSLAGAQAKTALVLQDGRWGIPSGRAPTTHILKPPLAEQEFDGHVENEHFCLVLARELGIPVARSEVRWFGGQVAIVVERFDRVFTRTLAASAAAEAAAAAARAAAASRAPDAARAAAEGSAAASRAAMFGKLAESEPILRAHQEDLCQALGRPPSSKYQSDGGPTPVEVVELLRTHSIRPVEDVWAFVDALIFNWVVAGTDAHAKNYSLLHGRGGRVRLAPLYDLASALPYDHLDPHRLKLAMKVGDKYRVLDVDLHQWQKLAQALRLDAGATVERIRTILSRLPEMATATQDHAHKEGIRHPIIAKLAQRIGERVAVCRRQMRLK